MQITCKISLLLFAFSLSLSAVAQPPVIRDTGPTLGWQPETFGAFVYTLCTDARGAIWVGTEDNGVWRYDPPAKSWRHWMSKDGLGDDTVFSLTCDKQGRIWAGHLNHGVSVWNGTAWKNYGVLVGPLGERIFDIAVCPTDGDVWMATNAGLARYHGDREWLYYHRGTGMPADQISALTFDAQGNLFAGTHCDGLALASAADDYQTWRSVVSIFPKMPATAAGRGLPGNIINDVLATKDGSVWVATTNGLARSEDGGKTWFFLRGDDWRARVDGLYHNPEAKDVAVDNEPLTFAGPLLLEDNVNCLAEDAAGRLWIGYNRKGCEARDPSTNRRLYSSGDEAQNNQNAVCVRSILPLPGAQPTAIFTLYGGNPGGLSRAGKVTLNAQAAPDEAAPFPAKAVVSMGLATIAKQLEQLDGPLMPGDGAYLGADWRTQGDWVGRYGRTHPFISRVSFEGQKTIGGKIYNIGSVVGPHFIEAPSVFTYIHWLKSDNHNVLFVPWLGVRRQAELNDGSWQADKYPPTWEGPDLWMQTKVPEGAHRISLYFFNKDSHEGPNRFRDYVIELKNHQENQNAEEAAPALAKARVRDFWGGVYQNFLVNGPGEFDFLIRRNGSHVAMLQGVFISKVGAKPAENFMPPGGESLTNASEDAKLASGIWSKAGLALSTKGGAAWDYPARLLAYRALAAEKTLPDTLTNWRWELPLWRTEDREEFEDYMTRTAQALPQKPATK